MEYNRYFRFIRLPKGKCIDIDLEENELSDMCLDDDEYTPRRTIDDNIVMSDNYNWYLDKLVWVFIICAMAVLKIVKYYVIYIAVHVLHEEGENFILFLFGFDMFIDIANKFMSSKWYKKSTKKLKKKKC